VVAALFAGPLVYLVAHALAGPTDALDALERADALGPLRRSVVLAVTVSIGATVVGTGLAWLTTRSDVPLRRMWRILAPLPLVVP